MDSRARDRTDGYYSLTAPSTPKSRIIDVASTSVNYSYPIQNNRDFHLPPHELGSVNFLNSREKSSERRRGNSNSGRRPRSRSSMFRDATINGNLPYETPTNSSFLRKRRTSGSVMSNTKNPRRLSSGSSNDKEGFETNRIGPITLDYLRFFCKILTEEKVEKKETGTTNEEPERDAKEGTNQKKIHEDKDKEMIEDTETKDGERSRSQDTKRSFAFDNVLRVPKNENTVITPNSRTRGDRFEDERASLNVFEKSLPLFDAGKTSDEIPSEDINEENPDNINKSYATSPISRKSRVNENQPRRAFSYLEKILNSHVARHHRRSLQFIIDVQRSPDKRKLASISNDAEIERDVAFIIDEEMTNDTDNGLNIESFSHKLDEENNGMLEPDNAFEYAMEQAEQIPEEANRDFYSSSSDTDDNLRNSELPIEAEIPEDDIRSVSSRHEEQEPDFSDDNNFLSEGFTLANYNESSVITDIEKEMALLERPSGKKNKESRNDRTRIPTRRNKKSLKKVIPKQTVKSLVKILEITNDLQGSNDKRKSGDKNYSNDVYQLIQEKSSEFILTVVSNLEAYSRHRTNSKSNQINIRDVLLYMKRVKEMEGLELDEPESLTKLAYKVLPLELLLSLDNSLQLYTNQYISQNPKDSLNYVEDQHDHYIS